GTDRAAEKAVGNTRPCRTAVGRPPHSAAGRPKVKKQRLSRHAGDSTRPPTAKRPDEAIFHRRKELRLRRRLVSTSELREPKKNCGADAPDAQTNGAVGLPSPPVSGGVGGRKAGRGGSLN